MYVNVVAEGRAMLSKLLWKILRAVLGADVLQLFPLLHLECSTYDIVVGVL